MKKQLISETALLQSVYKLRQYMSEGPATGQPAPSTPAPGTAAAVRAGQGTPAAAPAAAPVKTRYKTPAEYDAEIARFSKTSDPKLAPNKRYIDTLNAEKAALAGQGAKATNPAQAGKTPPAPKTGGTPPPKAAAPKVGYEKDFPEATAKELQTKLNAAGEKLTVDGKMGPATRAAMARHPEITSQSPESQAISADYKSANADPAQAAAATTGQGAQPSAPAADLSAAANGAAAAMAAPAAAPAAEPAAPAAALTPQQQAQNVLQPGTNPAPAANNPFAPKEDPKIAAWAKLSPEQQKWMGGADPTDPIILARMRAAVPDKAPAAAPAAAPNGAAAAMASASKPVAESAYGELDRIMSIVQYR